MAEYRTFLARLNKETESELIAWVQAQGSFVQLLRDLAGRAMANEPSNAELLQAINSLPGKIGNFTAEATGDDDEYDAPGTEEAGRNLDAWADM